MADEDTLNLWERFTRFLTDEAKRQKKANMVARDRVRESELYKDVDQFGRGVASNALALPWELASGIAAIPGYVGEKMGVKGPGEFARYLSERGQRGRAMVDKEPETGGQEFSQKLGAWTFPGGKETAILAGVGATLETVLDKFSSPTVAEEHPNLTPELLGPKPIREIETIGGPAQVPEDDLSTLGLLGLTTLGLIFAPKVYSKLKHGRAPKLRSVENAPEGTMAMSTVTDLARTYDDTYAGALRLAWRAGVPEQEWQTLKDTFRIQSRASAQNLSDLAVTFGNAKVPGLEFKVAVPLERLSTAETKAFQEYMHLWDTTDDLMAALNPRKGVKTRRKAGPTKIREHTKESAAKAINALEQTNPQLKPLREAYKQNLVEIRRVQSTGEYATLSQKEVRRLNSQNNNYVPFEGPRVTEEAVERGSPSHALAGDIRKKLRTRYENEAVGLYIDTVRSTRPELFKKVSAKQLKNNPHWKKNTASFTRRGKREYYATDPYLADVLSLDPYFMDTIGRQAVYSSKRLLEMGTTGALAPWFAMTSAIRSYQIGKYTTHGMKSPTMIGSVAAVPQQLYPVMAKAISRSLTEGTGRWLGEVLSPAAVEAISLRLAKEYDDGFYAQLAPVGLHRGSIMQQQTKMAFDNFGKQIKSAPSRFRPALNGYMELLQAVHNAPAYNFARRNKNVPIQKLAQEARHMTGDPRVGGQFYNRAGKPVRLEGVSKGLTAMTKAYGAGTELGRVSIPWYNYTVQGIKRIGEAYLANPTAFTGRVWLYSMMPAAGIYLWNRAMGADASGASYVDHMMNGRSNYQKSMEWYVALPGRSVGEGIRIPRFHELSIASRLMESAMDHLLRSNIFTEEEDMLAAALNYLDVVAIPPLPPAMSAYIGSQGMQPPMNAFGGETYRVKREPFDQFAGLPMNLDLVSRGLAGGIADVVGQSYVAFTQDEQSVAERLLNAAKAGAKRATTKAPLIRDIFNVHTPIGGATQADEELFKKQDAIDDLITFYRKWTSERTTATKPGEININPASKSGGEIVEGILGEGTSSESPGLNQPEPTNPLYIMFIKEFYDSFEKDAPSSGGQGFRSMWRRFGDYNEKVKRLRKVNAGNYVTWKEWIQEQPETMKELEEAGVDWKKPTAVRNFYTLKKQEAAKAILLQIKATENRFSERLNRPIKLEDLDPYGSP